MNGAAFDDRLLDAAYALAATHRLVDVQPPMLASAAGCDGREFRERYPDLTACLCAIQQRFMTRLRDRVLAAGLKQPAPFDRLKAGSLAYLDACLESRALRDWFVQARDEAHVLAAGLRRQNQTYLVMLAPEFKSLAWPHPVEAARIFLAMLMEASLVEHVSGRAMPDLRDTLWDYLQTY